MHSRECLSNLALHIDICALLLEGILAALPAHLGRSSSAVYPQQFVLLQGTEAGYMDDYVTRILPMIDSQLFGGVAEEKDAGAFAGTREAKKLRAYDSYQLLAQGITFEKQLANLLSMVGSTRPSFPMWHI